MGFFREHITVAHCKKPFMIGGLLYPCKSRSWQWLSWDEIPPTFAQPQNGLDEENGDVNGDEYSGDDGDEEW